MNRGWGRLALLAMILVAGVALARATGLLGILIDPEGRAQALDSLRGAAGQWWVGPVYALVYAAAVAFALPASILTLLGGAALSEMVGGIHLPRGLRLDRR